MSTPTVLVRPLPVAVPPQQGETLRSWMDRLAADLSLPIGLLLAAVGVVDHDDHGQVPGGYGLTLPRSRIDAVALATGQTTARVEATLLTALAGPALDLTGLDADVPDTFRQVAAREWLHVTGSACCPRCLADSGGVWPLAWRLPWTFACTRHQVLLVDTCPGCRQRPHAARRDGRSGPAFANRVPDPTGCPNPALPGEGHRGRAGTPCGTDLRSADAPWAGDPDHAGALAAQARIDHVLDASRVDVSAETITAGEWFADLRALVSVLLTHADTVDVQDALGTRPSRRRPDWALPVSAAAWHDHADARADRAAARLALRSSGVDARRGPRGRLWQAAPASTPLMALLCAAAVPALDSGTPDGLAPFAAAARRGNHPGLPSLLRDRHASPRLVALAEQAQRATGRFVAAAGIEHRSAPAKPQPLVAAHVPALLWPDEWPAFAPLFAGTGTRPDTARRFTATALVKSLAPLTWPQAGELLGWPGPSTRTLAANVVNRLNKAGTAQAFHAALADLADRLRTGQRPLVDLAARRKALAGLTTVPARVLRADGLVATDARRRNAAAWLWAELTSGSPFDAPAWGGQPVTASGKEVYRRFERGDLPRIEAALREHGQALLGRLPAASAADALKARRESQEPLGESRRLERAFAV